MVDDAYSTVAFGKNENCFHVAFKPDDWEAVQSQYPVGTILRLEMFAIGPDNGYQTQDGGVPDTTTDRDNAYNAGDAEVMAAEAEMDVDGLKNLINEIVDEMTEPLAKRMDENDNMLDEIRRNQKMRYETLPDMIHQEMQQYEGAKMPEQQE